MPEPPSSLPTPLAGQAVVGGALYSFTSEMLIPDTLIYLTPGRGPENRDAPGIVAGPDDSQGDIRGQTNADGQFIFTTVPPGNYFLVISTFNWSYGVTSADHELPLLIELQPDQTLSLGIVYVSWP